MWYTWGDLGFTGVKSTCGNKYCCNPFHLIPQRVGVFVDHDSYLESFELACQLHTLKQQVAEFVMEEALKQEARALEQELIDERADLLFDPDTSYGDRFEAVMTDILAGRHVNQLTPDEDTEYQEPNDNQENPTEEF
jgi:hypothetical protein